MSPLEKLLRQRHPPPILTNHSPVIYDMYPCITFVILQMTAFQKTSINSVFTYCFHLNCVPFLLRIARFIILK